LKAAGEPTRLRILALLGEGELTVNELVQVLDQSQPRVSRHLKMLAEAGLIERCQEGTWVFCRLADRGHNGALLRLLLGMLPAGDAARQLDISRLATVRGARAEAADKYFRANAADWNRIRSLYLPEEQVEARLLELLEGREVIDFLDIGTGTGRMLEILAPRVGHGIGIDANQDMLALARSMLAERGIANCQARHGDLYNLPMANDSQDAVVLHQVLHYVDDCEAAIAEAARVLRPGGLLLIADFAPHGEEFLRGEQAHRRLGFADQEVIGWAGLAGLEKRSISHLDGGRLSVTIWELEKTGSQRQEFGRAARPEAAE
jgi:ArsR family transcriptional regulator